MRAVVLALALLPSAASAHCFTIWHFKEPQRCGGGNNRPPVVRSINRVVSIAKRAAAPVIPARPEPSFDIPLPDADPATTALRAQLK
jgi:hypothetical protein